VLPALLAPGAWLAASGQTPRPATAVAGTVTTVDGKVRLPGVVVTLTTPDGRPTGETVTDEQGRYRIEVGAAGRYHLATAIDGFHPGGQDVEILAGATRIVDLDLRLIEIEQSVDVTPTADTPLNLSKPLSPAESIDGRAMAASAISSGNVAAELRWLPGLSPYGREWAIKGGRPNQIGLEVESAQVVDPASGTAPIELPGDAVSSIQVLANPYSVEFGRFSSGVIVVTTRSGANKWMATVNNFLPAFIVKRGSNPFRPTGGLESFNPHLALGGPLIKNRLFLAQSTQYDYDSRDVASRPQDQRAVSTKLSSFTRLDYVVNNHNTLTGMLTVAPENSKAVTLSTFDPPGETADLTQRVYRAGVSEVAQFPHAIVLESLAHFTRYATAVDGHGDATDMVLAPEGNSGIYYGKQTRSSDAWQFSQSLSSFVSGLWGEHLFKAGYDVLHASYNGTHEFRPIDILREDGTLAERLTADPSHLSFASTDAAGFVQDRWHLNDRLLLEFGVRLERDGVFDQVNFTPRVGVAIALDSARNATVRGGWGYFYERTPTLAGAYTQLSNQYEVTYDPDGQTPLGPPITWVHTFDGPPRTPHSTTWNVGYEHRIAPWLSARLNVLQREGHDELILDTNQTGPQAFLELESTGKSEYRGAEVGAHIKYGTLVDVDVSYTRSSSLADLNDAYGYYLNLITDPVVRANQYGPTDTDTPNRLVGRGHSLVGRNWMFEVAGELRTGFPYSAVNENLEFVGPRNSLRFPTYGLMDASVERRFRVGRFQPWIGLVIENALNSFVPVDVQRNVASPAFGAFYASPIRAVRITIHFHP
jgi:hypothetical protein